MTHPDRIRVGSSRSKSGCHTCRLRHLKCDEGKPVCSRCTKALLTCRYISTAVVAKPKRTRPDFVIYTADVVYPELAGLDSAARDALAFFRVMSAPDFGRICAAGFWSRDILLGAAHSVPIRHAIVALGAMHRTFSVSDQFNAVNKYLALKHYSKSIEALTTASNARSRSNTEIALTCCLLFYAIEVLQGHEMAAVTHVNSGIAVLTEAGPLLNSSNNAFVQSEHLRRAFVAYGSSIMDIQHTGHDRFVKLTTSQTPTAVATPRTEAGLLEEALAEMAALIGSALVVSHSHSQREEDEKLSPNTAKAPQEALLSRYKDWEAKYSRVSGRYPTSYISSSVDVLLLRMILEPSKKMFLIMMHAGSDPTEMMYDEHLTDFSDIVASVKAFFIFTTDPHTPGASSHPTTQKFSMTPGLVPCLFFVCTRCRDPQIRHEAWRVLSNCNRREAMWDSIKFAAIASAWISLEQAQATMLDHPTTHTKAQAFLGVPSASRIVRQIGTSDTKEYCFLLTTGQLVTSTTNA